jgi:hypothetical protein
MAAPDCDPKAAKTVELPRRTQRSFTRCFCGPNPSASPIQVHYEPFCSGSKVVIQRKLASSISARAPWQGLIREHRSSQFETLSCRS